MSGNGYDYPISGGGGGTNPTSLRMPINVGGVFLDSLLSEDVTRRVLQANSGIYLDTANYIYRIGDLIGDINFNSYFITAGTQYSFWGAEAKGTFLDLNLGRYYFGDFGGSDNGSTLLINDQNRYIATGRNLKTGTPQRFGININTNNGDTFIGDFDSVFAGRTQFNVYQTGKTVSTQVNGFDIGMQLDMLVFKFSFGDYTKQNQGTSLIIDDAAGTIYGLFNTTVYGIKLDQVNRISYIGDSDSTQNGTSFFCDDINRIIATTSQGLTLGLKVDYIYNKYWLGDHANVNNQTWMMVNDNVGTIEYSANLASGTAGGSSGQHLIVRVGGIDYKIALLNP